MISYGIHLSASGALTSMHRQDVITNNLANARTPGFKPDIALQIARDPARIEDGLGNLPSNELLERLGGGTHVLPTIVSYAQGVLEQTDRPLDMAIRGDGFFAVRDAAAAARDGGDGLRLTRDGRMTRSSDGLLVT
ncbi:MAG: flagellar hook-basal body complex protein, partial [Phycisphaerales bacterium]